MHFFCKLLLLRNYWYQWWFYPGKAKPILRFYCFMRLNPNITCCNIDFELDERSAVHSCFNRKTVPAIRGIFKIENSIPDYKLKKVFCVNSHKILKKIL